MSQPRRSTVIFAHESGVVRRACAQVLAAAGVAVELCADLDELQGALESIAVEQGQWALAVDAAIVGADIESIIAQARGRYVAPVVIVGTVYGRGAYKRAPKQLYGADAWVEVHRLGSDLPGLVVDDPSAAQTGAAAAATEATQSASILALGDQRLAFQAACLILEHAERYADLSRHDDALRRTLSAAKTSGSAHLGSSSSAPSSSSLEEAVLAIVHLGIEDDARRATAHAHPNALATGTQGGGGR